MRRSRNLVWFVGVLAIACGDDVGGIEGDLDPIDQREPDGGAEGSVLDAGSSDLTEAGVLGEDPANGRHDASADSAYDDAGAGQMDSGAGGDGTLDAGETEPGEHEAGVADAGLVDAGNLPLDAGGPGLDAGPQPDAAVPADAGPVADSGPAVDAGPMGGPNSFTNVFQIFQSRCRSCHVPGAAFSLYLTTRQIAYEELVGPTGLVPAKHIVCADKGVFRVVPFQPDLSLLMQKLEATHTCGDRMPPGGMLTAQQLAEVRGWIAAGALNN